MIRNKTQNIHEFTGSPPGNHMATLLKVSAQAGIDPSSRALAEARRRDVLDWDSHAQTVRLAAAEGKTIPKPPKQPVFTPIDSLFR